MKELTDQELVSLIKKGEVRSYEELVERYRGKLLRFVRRWLKDSNDIEEVVQDSLLKMYLGIDKIDEGRKFSSYLYAIARNEAISKLRRKKDTLPLLENVVGEEGEKIYEKLIAKENVDLLNKTLNKLCEMQKRVLKMYFFEELSYKRIQKRLGLTLNTVKTLLRRSKIDLAKRLTSAGMYISSHWKLPKSK